MKRQIPQRTRLDEQKSLNRPKFKACQFFNVNVSEIRGINRRGFTATPGVPDSFSEN